MFVLGSFHDFCASLETSQNAAAVLFTHVHSYRYSHRIFILLSLGTPLIVPLLCAISLLSSQGAKTHTCDMTNSAAIATFHNICIRTR